MDTLSPALTVLAVAAFYVLNTVVGLVIGYALERLSSRRVWALPLAPGQMAHELRGNLTFIAVCVGATSAFVIGEAITFGDDGGGRVFGTFAALFVSFQAFYYALHRALHLPQLVRFHRHHHESRVTTPLSGQSTSLVEAIGWMGGYMVLPSVISLVVPISPVGLAAYLSFNVIGNIVGHANVEVVPTSKTLWWRSLSAAVFTYHALHHARWTGHYGFASTWADRLCRTEWRDWPALHAQVWGGQPMTSLKDKGELRP